MHMVLILILVMVMVLLHLSHHWVECGRLAGEWTTGAHLMLD